MHNVRSNLILKKSSSTLMARICNETCKSQAILQTKQQIISSSLCWHPENFRDWQKAASFMSKRANNNKSLIK